MLQAYLVPNITNAACRPSPFYERCFEHTQSIPIDELDSHFRSAGQMVPGSPRSGPDKKQRRRYSVFEIINDYPSNVFPFLEHALKKHFFRLFEFDIS